MQHEREREDAGPPGDRSKADRLRQNGDDRTELASVAAKGAHKGRAACDSLGPCAGCSTSFVHELSSIASQIGIIYQLRDDVLGLFGDETLTGKSVLSDLREGKETLLITFARSDPAWAQVASDFGDRNLDASGGQRLRRVIEESGARVFVESVITQRVEALNRAIDEAAFPSALNAQLMALSAACSSRQI